MKDRELNLRRQAYTKVDEHGRPSTAVKQKPYEMEADTRKLQRRPQKQQRQQSRSPHDKKEKNRKTSTMPAGTWRT